MGEAEPDVDGVFVIPGAHFASMRLDESFHYRQADARPPAVAGTRFFHTVEPLEDEADIFFRELMTSI